VTFHDVASASFVVRGESSSRHPRIAVRIGRSAPPTAPIDSSHVRPERATTRPPPGISRRFHARVAVAELNLGAGGGDQSRMTPNPGIQEIRP